jgi:hypothetical protein
MRQPSIDDRVRLTHDVPELELHRGTIGVVRSTWLAPRRAYEVEFNLAGLDNSTRALLLEEQVELSLEDNSPDCQVPDLAVPSF